MPDDDGPHTIDVLPERNGSWSVCVMDEAGTVIHAELEMPLEEAVGKAGMLSKKFGVQPRYVDSPARPNSN